MLNDSMTRYVGRFVSPSVLAFLAFSSIFCVTAPAQLLEKHYHCPCPPARDFGSHEYGLVLQIAAAALTHFISFFYVLFAHLSMQYFLFSVACTQLQPALSIRPSIDQSVSQFITFLFSDFFFTSLLL